MSTHNGNDNSDEDTNGSFEFVDKMTDSDNKSDSDKDDLAKKKSEDGDQWEDVLGSGQLLKKIIKPGRDGRPERQDICEIKYECRYNDEVVEKVDSCKILVSESELIQGLDLIIPLMFVGEVSEVKVGPRFAYGSKGYKDGDVNIPPDATLHYTVQLVSVSTEPEIETMDVQTRKETGLRKKVRGNWWFSREEYIFAIQCYKKAIQYLDYNESDDVEQAITKTEADQLIDERINVYNNLSAAQLKTNSTDEALNSAEIVLKLQPNNVKALFRKAMALAEKGERTEAVKYLKRGLQIEPQNARFQNELQKLQNLLARDVKTERNLYKKMFEPTKSEKLNRSTEKNTWMKLGVFIGSLAVAVLGALIYRYNVE